MKFIYLHMYPRLRRMYCTDVVSKYKFYNKSVKILVYVFMDERTVGGAIITYKTYTIYHGGSAQVLLELKLTYALKI